MFGLALTLSQEALLTPGFKLRSESLSASQLACLMVQKRNSDLLGQKGSESRNRAAQPNDLGLLIFLNYLQSTKPLDILAGR